MLENNIMVEENLSKEIFRTKQEMKSLRVYMKELRKYKKGYS